MEEICRLTVGDVNPHLVCKLCGGYFVDATTIIECLHSFCRTCIVTYLWNSKTCPTCDTVVHKTRPHENIRSDKLLQDLVYKLVPGLYKDEMRRRREFYTTHYEDAPKKIGEERGDEMSERFIYTQEEKISLVLHCCSDYEEVPDFKRVFTSKEQLKARMEKRIKESVDIRYLQCKAAVRVGLLKKFLRLKYKLPAQFKVDMYYNEEMLKDNMTLCDVAYMFTWRRCAPLRLYFTVYENVVKKCSWGSESSRVTNSNVLDTWVSPEVLTSPPAVQSVAAEQDTEADGGSSSVKVEHEFKDGASNIEMHSTLTSSSSMTNTAPSVTNVLNKCEDSINDVAQSSDAMIPTVPSSMLSSTSNLTTSSIGGKLSESQAESIISASTINDRLTENNEAMAVKAAAKQSLSVERPAGVKRPHDSIGDKGSPSIIPVKHVSKPAKSKGKLPMSKPAVYKYAKATKYVPPAPTVPVAEPSPRPVAEASSIQPTHRPPVSSVPVATSHGPALVNSITQTHVASNAHKSNTQRKVTKSLLGKRPATTPIPIAPAPTKFVAVANPNTLAANNIIKVESAFPNGHSVPHSQVNFQPQSQQPASYGPPTVFFPSLSNFHPQATIKLTSSQSLTPQVLAASKVSKIIPNLTASSMQNNFPQASFQTLHSLNKQGAVFSKQVNSISRNMMKPTTSLNIVGTSSAMSTMTQAANTHPSSHLMPNPQSPALGPDTLQTSHMQAPPQLPHTSHITPHTTTNTSHTAPHTIPLTTTNTSHTTPHTTPHTSHLQHASAYTLLARTPSVAVAKSSVTSGNSRNSVSKRISSQLLPPPLAKPVQDFSQTSIHIASSSSSSSSSSSQMAKSTSMASPTPASSASPTPAAVPSQQSQTQGSDLQISTNKPTQTPAHKQQKQMPLNNQSDSGVQQSGTVNGGHCHQESNVSRAPVDTSRSIGGNGVKEYLREYHHLQNISNVKQNGVPTATLRYVDTQSVKSINSVSAPSQPSHLNSPFMSPSFKQNPKANLTSPMSLESPSSFLSTSSSSDLSPSPQGKKPKVHKKIADIANSLQHKRLSECQTGSDMYNQNINFTNKLSTTQTVNGQITQADQNFKSPRPQNTSSPVLTSRPQQRSASPAMKTLILPLSPIAASALRQGLAVSGSASLSNTNNGNIENRIGSGRGEEPLNLVKRDHDPRLIVPPAVK